MQRVCSYTNCSVRPSYGYEWKEPTYCSKHKKENMENVVDKRCIIKGCIKAPIYGIVEGIPTHCYAHKNENMSNVKSKKCAEKDCIRIPTYGFEKNKPVYCAQHCKKEMVNCRSSLCQEKDCKKVSSFGYIKPTHCKQHSNEDMKYLKCGLARPHDAYLHKTIKSMASTIPSLPETTKSGKSCKSGNIRYERSFASFEGLVPDTNLRKTDCWDEEGNTIKPNDVTLKSSKKYWFICPICNHTFKCAISKITKDNYWCTCGAMKNTNLI